MLHILTDDDVVCRTGWVDLLVEAAHRAGPRVRVHLRAPRASGADLFRWAHDVSTRIAGTGAAFSVNDRVDVAAAVGADVHLGQRSLAVEDAKEVAPSALVGLSCHDAAEVSEAVRVGADYLFIGAVHTTASHPGAEALGLDRWAVLAAGAGDLPLVGIGGVGPRDVAGVVGAGASGVAVIRGFWDAPDSLGALASYISALDGAREGV